MPSGRMMRVMIGLLSALALLVVLAACNTFEGDDPGGGPRLGRITSVTVTPEPAAPGDTVTISCTTDDAYWSFLFYLGQAGVVTYTDTTSARTCLTRWVAPESPGVYRHLVQALSNAQPAADTLITTTVAAP